MKARVSSRSVRFLYPIGKSTICAALILLISITALWPAGGLAMKAGASKRDITVPELLGNPIIHDPLFARVLVLDDGDSSVAIITRDNCIAFFPEVRENAYRGP